VLECTGKINDGLLAKVHLESGAKRVLLSAQAKTLIAQSFYGVNDHEMQACLIYDDFQRVLHDQTVSPSGQGTA